MLETKFWFGDTRVTRLSLGDWASREALVMFHGFPGQYPAAEAEKYRDAPRMRVEAAKAVVAAAGIDAYLPSYEGLGESRGAFSFHRSVTRSAELAGMLAGRGYRALHIGGHSWGAFVGFNVHRGLGSWAGRLGLFAGLLDIPDTESIRAFLPEYIRKYPEILGADAGALERAVEDLDLARRDFNPMARAEPMTEENLFIAHGRPDASVNVEISRRFHQKAGGRYLEVDDDHIFSRDMPRIVGEIASFFGAKAAI